MRLVRLVTIVLFSISVFFGLSILYDVLTNHPVISNTDTISKDKAISIATNYSGLTQQDLSSDVIDAKLLQAKLSNRVAFVINYPTMTLQAFPQLEPLESNQYQENQLFWRVEIRHYLSPYKFKSWGYDIDATNGTLIQRHTPME